MKSVDVFPAVLRVAEPGSLEDITELNIYGNAPEGSRYLDRCRIVILGKNVLVAVDSPSGPQLVFREEVAETRQVEKMWYVKTISGKILAFRKDDNCGCGSRLRGWNPYGNILTSTEDPK